MAASSSAEAMELEFDGEVRPAEPSQDSSDRLAPSLLCATGDGQPRLGANIFCHGHKRTGDNLYNQEKARTGGKGEEWEEFKDNRKRGSAQYVSMVVAAHEVKGEVGKGKKSPFFPVMSFLRKEVSSSTAETGNRKVFKTLIGFANLCKTELGWDMTRSRLEWDHLLSRAQPEEQKNTLDRVAQKDVEWLLVDLEDYVQTSNAKSEIDEAQYKAQDKNNYTAEDVHKFQKQVGGHKGFNDTFYSPVKRGVQSECQNAFSSGGVSSAPPPPQPPRGVKREPGAEQGSASGKQTAKKNKVWSQEEETCKVSADCVKKVGLLADAARAIQEKVASSLEVGISAEELEECKRFFDVHEVRLPLKDAWAWGLSDTSSANTVPEKLPPGATADQTQEFQEVREVYTIVMSGMTGTDLPNLKEWSAAFKDMEIATKLLGSRLMKVDGTHPDGGIASAIFHKYRQGSGDGQTFLPKTAQDWKRSVETLCRCSYARINFGIVCTEFQEAGHTLPVKTSHGILPHAVLLVFASEMFADTEHALKQAGTKLKADIESAKLLIERIKTTVTASIKAVAGCRVAAVKKEKDKDKVRVQEEKAKLNAAKEQLRAVRALCKDKNSPGLLSFCGQTVSDIRRYRGIDEFKVACADDDFDVTAPYIIEECKSLTDLAQHQLVKMAFTNFRAQLPTSDAAKQKKKAQCPFQYANSDQVSAAMLELTPKSRIPFVTDGTISQWGCMPDMLAAGLEHQGLGNIRYTAKGSREVACVHYSFVQKVAEGISESRTKVLAISDKYTVADMVENTLLKDMDEKGLSIAEQCGMKAFRGTVPAGSLCFIPAGFATVERALGSEAVQGWRTALIEGPNVLESLSVLEHMVKSYTTDEKKSILAGIALVRRGIEQVAKRMRK